MKIGLFLGSILLAGSLAWLAGRATTNAAGE
jgi:hypothetical protein